MAQKIVRETGEPSRRAGIWLAAALTLFALRGTLDADSRIEVGEPVAVSGKRPEIPQVEPSLAAHPEKPGLLFGAAVTFSDLRKGFDAITVAGFRSAACSSRSRPTPTGSALSSTAPRAQAVTRRR